MSFTTDISGELLQLPIKKTCCKRALTLGILCASRDGGERGERVSYFYNEGVATLALDLLDKIFHVKSELLATVRAGRRTFILRFCSQGVSDFLATVDREGSSLAPHIAIGYKCPACETAFLRGVFLGCGSVSDPQKSGYHLEMSLPTQKRAELVERVITDKVGAPNKIRRGERYSVYYKKHGAITDFLCYIGCSRTSFGMANVCIERDIRNNENRATNCVARNISRSVEASHRQISAIGELYRSRKIDTLSDELRYTAELRIENEEASLSELALLHEPPISKSGLNRRLSKLVEEAEEK